MADRLSARYRDAAITLEIDDTRKVRLAIDGVTRARAVESGEGGAGCYLATTLQTAYEYHSLVEGWLRITADADRELLIKVDGAELARKPVSSAPPGAEVMEATE